MRMTIRFHGGSRVEAVLLAASRETMRVIIGSQRDTSEIHRVGGCWFTEAEEEIEIEALIPIEIVDVSAFCAAVYPMTFAAGSNSKPSDY